ncbi:glyco_like_cofC transferase, GTA_type superfamily [Psychroflexus torquis ATCC 700755]|uniref:Glyco_like_cofC transferase, GTA_type superfamily n=1 Tax=Psychroflexus torquis (strain ATCC 700755 / CIP 106069 / ACAM 623) TaxID=313595 RepID=K4ITX8_PSYTT|nr:TIGR04282 family arsenosugar biosynthesis glycosyltransferase [Psychroflexus torquis]AFU68940.1 glyco_like_cofC transferase, GTA_type superfamily [Psychroflexus torquis ATCC 700755]
MDQLVIVFAKNPELGKCKTRLAVSIGDENTLAVYKALIQYTAKVLSKLKEDCVVFYSENIQTDDLWNDADFQKQVQSQGHLGKKMQAAFEWGFHKGYKQVCIVGSDLFELEVSDIHNAFQALETHDLVFGPAEDGGYYLMGMSAFHPEAFKDKAWSTELVLKETLHDLKGKSFQLLKEKNDIDTVDDLKKYKKFHHFIPYKLLN